MLINPSLRIHFFLKKLEPKDGYMYATILAALVGPQSRGNVTLNSADTNILPTINSAYLQSPTDQKVAIVAYKRVRQAFASRYMQQTVIGDEYYPSMQVQTDAQILEVCADAPPLWMGTVLTRTQTIKAVSKLSGTHPGLARWELRVTRWLLLPAMLVSSACKVSELWMPVLSHFCLLDTHRHYL